MTIKVALLQSQQQVIAELQEIVSEDKKAYKRISRN